MLATATTTATASKDTRIKLPAMHQAQKVIKRGMGRYNVVCAGRRFGKDVLAQDRAIRYAGYKRQSVGWFAPSYRMLSDNYKMLNNTLAPIITRKLNNTYLELVGGGLVEFWSTENADRARGHEYGLVIVNEAAMIPDMMDIYNLVIAPMLIKGKSPIDFYSTPKGLNGFYELWQMALDIQGWERFHYTTYENPTLDRVEIDMIANAMPERVKRQEILAEFLEDGAYFQNVQNAAVIEEPDRPDEHPGHTMLMGVDWAKQNDYTVLTVGCRDCNRVVDWESFNQIDFTYQREKLYTMAGKWNAVVLPERNSIGEPNIEIIRDKIQVLNGPDGKPGFQTTATSKPMLIEGLAAGMAVHGFQVPADYKQELQVYQVEILKSGRSAFEAPSGQHDDKVISLALCWFGMSNISPLGGVW